MYRISTNVRKYSTTPIVEIITLPNGKVDEKIMCVITLPKKEGDILSKQIVEALNNNFLAEAIDGK